MDRINIENALRPLLQNMNVVGARGPPKDWVFPAMLATVVIFALLAALILGTYEFIFQRVCPLCGNQHK